MGRAGLWGPSDARHFFDMFRVEAPASRRSSARGRFCNFGLAVIGHSCLQHSGRRLDLERLQVAELVRIKSRRGVWLRLAFLSYLGLLCYRHDC